MKMNGVTLIIAAAMLFTFAPAMSHEAHVHGIGKLDVAVEGANLSLHLDTPLANLVGFEHTAKSDKDKNAILWQLASVFDQGIDDGFGERGKNKFRKRA
jgi:hypothetical protein